MQTIIHNHEYACEKFASVYEFIRQITQRPANKVFTDKELHSQRVDDRLWSGTHTYLDSIRIFREGYREGMESITRDMKPMVDTTPKPRCIAAIIGSGPHIPNYLKGRPENMVYRKRIPQEMQLLNIYYDRAAHCGITSDELFRSSRLLLSAVSHFEAHGIHTSLHVMIVSCTTRQKVGLSILVKGNNDSLNPMKVAYPMVHPSFFRRQCFRWLETTPIMHYEGFLDGYGQPLDTYSEFEPLTLDQRRHVLIENEFIGERDIFIDNALLRHATSLDEVISTIEQQYHSFDTTARAI